MKKITKGIYYLEDLGTPSIISIYLIDSKKKVLIESGPSATVSQLIQAIVSAGFRPSEIDHIVVTHIHLDHAGGASLLLQAMPNADVLVSKKGAPHLIEPSRLRASAKNALGPIFEIWGGIEATNSSRIHTVEDGMSLDLGDHVLQFLSTPGHAPHHISILEESSRVLFTGDAVGIYYNDLDALIPASPPPSFDVELALQSLNRLSETNPQVLLTPHYGIQDNPSIFLKRNLETYARWKEIVNSNLEKGSDLDFIIEDLCQAYPSYRTLVNDVYRGTLFRMDIKGYLK